MHKWYDRKECPDAMELDPLGGIPHILERKYSIW